MTAPRVLTETLVLRDLDGHTLPPGRYVWRGGANAPVFHYRDSREIVCADVVVECETDAAAVFLVERTRTGAGVIPSTMHQWRNVRVVGTSGTPDVGFLYRGIDQNNEHGRWDSCSVYGCIVGWSFVGQQSKEHLLTHCRAESCGVGVSSSSSFQWIGGACAVASVGVRLMRVGDPVRIAGVGFEACGRLLVTAGPTSDAQAIVLESIRFAADQLHPDGDCVLLRHAGALTLIGGSLGNGDQPIPFVRLAGTGEQTATFIGTHFGSFGASEVHPVKVNPGVSDIITRIGCTYQTSATNPSRTTTLNTAPVGRA